MSDFRDHLKQSLSNKEFKQEWDSQSVEREIVRQIVEARLEQGMSQVQLANACGMKPANLCRLENGNGNPSVATLVKIAHGLNRKLKVSFV